MCTTSLSVFLFLVPTQKNIFITLKRPQFSYSSWYPPEEDPPEINILLFLSWRNIIYPGHLLSTFSIWLNYIFKKTISIHKKSPIIGQTSHGKIGVKNNVGRCNLVDRTYYQVRKINDVVHPKTSPFSTRHLIWVKYKVLIQLYQLIFLSFSYLNSARHNLVIGLCREQLLIYFFRLQRKSS